MIDIVMQWQVDVLVVIKQVIGIEVVEDGVDLFVSYYCEELLVSYWC